MPDVITKPGLYINRHGGVVDVSKTSLPIVIRAAWECNRGYYNNQGKRVHGRDNVVLSNEPHDSDIISEYVPLYKKISRFFSLSV